MKDKVGNNNPRLSRLCSNAIGVRLTLEEHEAIRALIPEGDLVGEYVDRQMADEIRESLKDGE